MTQDGWVVSWVSPLSIQNYYSLTRLAMPYFITERTGLPAPNPSDPNYTAEEAAFTIPAWKQSLMTSVLSAGTFFGALMAGDIADFFGRRVTIITGCLVFALGCILQIATTHMGVVSTSLLSS